MEIFVQQVVEILITIIIKIIFSIKVINSEEGMEIELGDQLFKFEDEIVFQEKNG